MAKYYDPFADVCPAQKEVEYWEDTEVLMCELKPGHAGAHQDRDAHWDETGVSYDLPKFVGMFNGELPSDASVTVKDRVRFEGGGMRDSQDGKPRFDLLIPEGMPFDQQYLTRCAHLLAKGAAHYEDRNWEKFGDEDALNRARSSAFRHFMQWFTGETDEDHAASVFFNIQAVEFIKWKMGNNE